MLVDCSFANGQYLPLCPCRNFRLPAKAALLASVQTRQLDIKPMHTMDMQSAVIARLPLPDELASFKVVKNLVTSALLECCSIDEFEALKETLIIESVSEQAHADLQAFAQKDPAAGRDLVFIARTYTSYSAVLHYRLAHWVYCNTVLSTVLAASAWPHDLQARKNALGGGDSFPQPYRCALHHRSRHGHRHW